jgi:hypothetical protein
LLGARQLTVDETAVRFVENGEHASMVPGGDPAASVNVPSKSGAPRELVWAKGVKLLVLDEHDRPLPTAEFICHFNVDVEPRAAIFPEVHTGSLRLFTLTQGQTDFHFPVGYGVPLASDESIHIKFQAANRTTTEHRRLKHVCTLELIKDANLKAPMKALSWYTPFMAVEINGAETPVAPTIHGQNCLALSTGENAPNAIPGSVVDYARGRKVTGHWKVPPGEHLYTCPLTADRDFKLSDEDRIVRAVWTHVHPLCKEATMLVCDGNKKTPLWTVHVKTKTKPGLEIEKISDLYFDEGVVLPKGKHLEIDAVYDNSTAKIRWFRRGSSSKSGNLSSPIGQIKQPLLVVPHQMRSAQIVIVGLNP